MNNFETREQRIRTKLRKISKYPRLTVFRSNNHIYTQIIDDAKGNTLASANTLQKAFTSLAKKSNTEAARSVAKALAEAALKNGITQVVFDKGGYKYHGRVKVIADTVRESGIRI